MNAGDLIRLFKIMPKTRAQAESPASIGRRFWGLDERRPLSPARARHIQRQLLELSTGDGTASVPVERVQDDGKPPRYYLRSLDLIRLLMSDEAALHLLLTQQSVERLEPLRDSRSIAAAAEVASMSPRVRRLGGQVRLVADGLGRMPAAIAPAVLQAAIDAIARGRQLAFTYLSSTRHRSDHVATVQGLVVKDGTIYLVATRGFDDGPMHRPLQRVERAEVSELPAVRRDDFDLDAYIEASHQLSHVLGGDGPASMHLRLRVAPEALYHFAERPLAASQTIGAATGDDGWHVVSAQVPNTLLLRPFLWSMGKWVEVLEPAALRCEVGEVLASAARLYATA